MPTARLCRTHKGPFTPPRFRPWQRECEPCRGHFFAPERADRDPSKAGALRTYLPGLLNDATGVRSQASVARGKRIDPSKLDDHELMALRRRHLPTQTERDEDVLAANRRYALDCIATPRQAALVVAIDTEGDMP